jgi:hypothetical protein
LLIDHSGISIKPDEVDITPRQVFIMLNIFIYDCLYIVQMRDNAGRALEKVLQSNLNGAVCVHANDELRMQRAECWILLSGVAPGGSAS